MRWTSVYSSTPLYPLLWSSSMSSRGVTFVSIFSGVCLTSTLTIGLLMAVFFLRVYIVEPVFIRSLLAFSISCRHSLQLNEYPSFDLLFLQNSLIGSTLPQCAHFLVSMILFVLIGLILQIYKIIFNPQKF